MKDIDFVIFNNNIKLIIFIIIIYPDKNDVIKGLVTITCSKFVNSVAMETFPPSASFFISDKREG